MKDMESFWDRTDGQLVSDSVRELLASTAADSSVAVTSGLTGPDPAPVSVSLADAPPEPLGGEDPRHDAPLCNSACNAGNDPGNRSSGPEWITCLVFSLISDTPARWKARRLRFACSHKFEDNAGYYRVFVHVWQG